MVKRDEESDDGRSKSYGSSKSTPTNKPETKRRRVTRACDNCRQKKVKCDGKQPCIHCTVYSYVCTYDQPNIRNKNSNVPPPQSEPILAAAQIKNSKLAKNISNHIINNNLIICQNIINLLVPKLGINCLDLIVFDFDKFQKAVNYSMNKNGEVSLREVQNVYNSNDDVSSIESSSPTYFVKRDSILNEELEIKLILPPKSTTLQLIYTTWDKACVLFRFYHRPSLLEEVDLIYAFDPSKYGDRQQKFLPFLYSILACGSLFSKSKVISSTENTNLEDDGFKYFLEARKLIDIPNVADIPSIQTIVMMIMYLQCSARLSTCYSYIGIALRSALKEGLHRNLAIFQNSRRKLDPIEIDTRKRLFYTIYKMDIYINSLLGLPRSINEDEFDQELPEDLDDENVTRTEYLFDKQQGRLSSSACANHHTKLMFVLSHIIKKLYPIKVKKSTVTERITPDDIHANVTELELELKCWLDQLPNELKPTDPSQVGLPSDIPGKFILANYYIHLAFLNCQIMLYRPFIHFVSNGNITTSDPRSLIRGRNCIKVARTVVKLANKMIDQNLLVGTYWFSMYTIFFSIACLVYYYHFASNNPNSPKNATMGVNYAGILFDDDLNIDMIKNDIEIGKKVLNNLKNNSNSSLRIYNILNTLFEQLNRRTASSADPKNSNESQASVASNIPNIDFDHSIPHSNSIAATEVSRNSDMKNFPLNFDANNKNNSDQDRGYQNQYVPGVFDKLDAQIFGKILPPYMLEKNYSVLKSQINSPKNELENFNANSAVTLDANDINHKINNNQTNEQHHLANPLDNIKMDDFDLLAFGDQDLEYLDPFNSTLDMNFIGQS